MANDVPFAKFAKVFPRQNFALYGNLYSTETRTRARSQTNLRASRLSMFQLQAEHRHAAGLIDLLFKGRVICFTAALPYIQAGC